MLPVFSLVHIDIHITKIRGNPQLNYGDGGQTTQSNDDQIAQSHLYCPAEANERHVVGQPTEKRVEAQRKIRRKLDEVSKMGPEAVLGVNVVAFKAIAIMSAVDNNAIRCAPLVELSMSAHAVAYITVISCLYGLDGRRRKGRAIKRSVSRLRRLLNTIHKALDDETRPRCILGRLLRCMWREKRRRCISRMHEELLGILRDIESNDNPEILSSLELALNCPY